MVSSMPPVKGLAIQQNPESKKIAKPKAKPAKSSKKPKPTVIHAKDASSFRNLVQQLTSSNTEPGQTPNPPTQIPEPPAHPLAPPPSTPQEPEASGKSRIQSLAPPPLRPRVISAKVIQPKPVHASGVSRPAPVRPTNPLTLSGLTSIFSMKAIPFSPLALFSPLGGLLSPFTSRHAVASPGTEINWLNPDTPEQQSDAESPGAIAFREALNVMLPPGSNTEMQEESSFLEQPAAGGQEITGNGTENDAAMLVEKMQQGAIAQS
jgi:hypothetical protein